MQKLSTQAGFTLVLLSAATITGCASTPDYLETRPAPVVENYPPVPASTETITVLPETGLEGSAVDLSQLEQNPDAQGQDDQSAVDLTYVDGVVVQIPADLMETDGAMAPSDKKKK